MKKLINILLATCMAVTLVGCYNVDEDEDTVATDARISIYPTDINFMADGTTEDGEAYGIYIVTVNPLEKRYEEWNAELVDTDWATLERITVEDSNGVTENAVRIGCSENRYDMRTGTLRITLINTGESADFPIVQAAGPEQGVVVASGIKLIRTTNSTLTYSWEFAEDTADNVAASYELGLYSDESCSNLVVGWTIGEESGLFNSDAGCRFVFAGLEPSTTYYCRVECTSFPYQGQTTDVLAGTTLASGPVVTATADGSAVEGDILVAEDFSKIYHGGQLSDFAVAYYVKNENSYRSENIKAEGMDDARCTLAPFNTSEFDVFDGGGVTSGYTEGVGLGEWAHEGTAAGRSGHLKIGASGANGAIWTPVLNALPVGNSSVEVSFSAKNYITGFDGTGADLGQIVVSAVADAEVDSKYNATGGTVLSESSQIDITGTTNGFETFTVTLNNVSPKSRIRIATVENRAFIDDIVVTYLGTTAPMPAEVNNRVVAAQYGSSTESGDPPCSIAAFNYAIGLGVYAVYVSPYVTSDNEVIIARKAGGNGNEVNGLVTYENTLADIRAAGKLSNGEDIPTLQEFLEIALEAGTTRLLLGIENIQYDGSNSNTTTRNWAARGAERCCEIIKEMNAQNFCEFSVTSTTGATVDGGTIIERTVIAASEIGCPVGWVSLTNPSTYATYGCTWANLNSNSIMTNGVYQNPSYTIDQFFDANLEVSVYNANYEVDMQYYRETYGDKLRCITTTYPKLLLENW